MTDKIKVVIKDNSYEVKFPLVGQFLDIEMLKASLSKGQYGTMFKSGTVDSIYALDMIDTEAYLTVLIPELLDRGDEKGDLKVKSFRELGIKDMLELKDIFKKQILPFIDEIRDLIHKTYTNKIKNDQE